MQIYIKKNKFITEDFIKYLCKHLYEYSVSLINDKKFILWDSYLKSKVFYNKHQYTCSDVFKVTFIDVKWHEFYDHYSIQIGKLNKVPHYNYTWEQIFRIINYGNASSVGLNVYSLLDRFLHSNLNKLYRLYKAEEKHVTSSI